MRCDLEAHDGVAPRAGAWIETPFPPGPLALSTSPLVQGRGLKLAKSFMVSGSLESPLVQGRGLKHEITSILPEKSRSPLVQGRGLKQRIQHERLTIDWSPLVQGRGLKLILTIKKS